MNACTLCHQPLHPTLARAGAEAHRDCAIGVEWPPRVQTMPQDGIFHLRLHWRTTTSYRVADDNFSRLCSRLHRLHRQWNDALEGLSLYGADDCAGLVNSGYARLVLEALRSAKYNSASFMAALEKRTSPKTAYFDWGWMYEFTERGV